MNTLQLGQNYSRIAKWWESEHKESSYGVPQVQKALNSAVRGSVLDVGCGSGGQILKTLEQAGYHITALDASEGMQSIARTKHPDAEFILTNFMEWQDPRTFDLVIAWDSIFHTPSHLQQPTIEKLCSHLTPGGILLFTAGGVDGDIQGEEMNGVPFEYGSLHYLKYLNIIDQCGCEILTMEYDQPNHMYFICKKTGDQHVRNNQHR